MIIDTKVKDLRELIERVINVYNKYRAPESIAKLININENLVVIEFKGSFCYTCGIIDRIEDLRYIISDVGIKTELMSYEKLNSKDIIISVLKILK